MEKHKSGLERVLAKINPVVSRGLSGALLRFLGPQFEFWRNQSVSSEVSACVVVRQNCDRKSLFLLLIYV